MSLIILSTLFLKCSTHGFHGRKLFIILSRTFLAACVLSPYQTVMPAVMMLSVGLGERAVGQTSFPDELFEVESLLCSFSL